MNTLAMNPADAVRIGASCFSFASGDGRTACFSNLEPFDCHDESDRPAMLLRIARFARHGIPRKDLQDAFGVGRATVQRAVRKLRDRGEAAFHEPRKGRGTSAIAGETAAEAERLLASGMRIAAVARELGIAPATLCHNCRKGFIACPDAGTEEAEAGETEEASAETEEASAETEAGTAEAEGAGTAAPLGRSARDRRDRAAPMGRAARDSAGRVAASAGAMDEARPRFDEPLSAVACGGVLAALPALLEEGLLQHADRFLALPKGYYGCASSGPPATPATRPSPGCSTSSAGPARSSREPACAWPANCPKPHGPPGKRHHFHCRKSHPMSGRLKFLT